MVESDEHIAQTYVRLDEKNPFIEFKGKQPQSENVFIVIPNIIGVDYVENFIDESALISSNRLCTQLDDHEVVTIEECEHCSSIDINKSIMRNRLSRHYVKSIDHLSTATMKVAFKKYFQQELSPSRLLTYKRNSLQEQWDEPVSEADEVMEQYRLMKSWYEAQAFQHFDQAYQKHDH